MDIKTQTSTLPPPPAPRQGPPEHEDRSRYWFARHSKSIVFLVCTLALVGGYLAYTSIPVAVFPSTNFPRIIIGVDNGVMPIDQMEVTITRPIESAVNSVPGLNDVRSITSRGSAEIDLSFDWGSDMITTLQQVNSAVSRIQSTLPSTVQIDMNRLDFASFPIIGYSMTSDKIPQTQLWEMATYDMKPRLNRLSGVASVLIQGGQEPEFRITPDPALMIKSKVTVPNILDAVNKTNLIDSPGLLNRNHELYLALLTSQVANSQQIGDIVIKTAGTGGPAGDTPVRIRDVATVTSSYAPNYTIVTADRKPAVLISVNRQPDSNTVTVANEVHQEMADLLPSLPAGVVISPFYDQSNIVSDSIKSVRDAILLGLLLTCIIIWLFLRDFGTAAMTGLVVPITMLVTFIAMKLLGQSFNLMTLGGLAAAAGLVIDDAIVVVENIVLHRDGGEQGLEATNSALKELTIPLIGSTLTPIVVFLPLVVITGVVGVFFRALAVAMSVALLTSLALALVWTTNLSTFLIRRHGEKHADASGNGEANGETSASVTNDRAELMRRMMAAEEASLSGGWFGRIIDVYTRSMRRALKHPIWLAGFSIVLIVVSYVCYNALGSDLLPAMDEGGFILDYVMPPGSSLQETDRVMSHIEDIIRSVPEVESLSRRTGLQLGLAAVTEANTGDFAVKLKADRSRGIDEVIADVRKKVTSAEPEVDVDFHQMLEDMIGDLTGAPQPVVVKLFSPDADLLDTWAPRVADALGGVAVNGKNPVVDIDDGIESTTSGPAVTYTINPATATRAGFTTDELTTDASAIVDGEPATTPVIVGDRPYTVRVRYPASTRSSLDAMSNTPLVSSSGSTATLGSMATVTEDPGETEVISDNLQREVEVAARLEGVDLGTGVAAVQKAVTGLRIPSSIRVEYGGTYKEQQDSFRGLVTVLLLALVLIFIVLLFEFRTFTAPLAILSSAVLSTSGVFFALFITGTTFSVSSFIGLIMVVGIVAKNGILLLDAFQKFRSVGLSKEEAIIQAGRRRLRPIVMTAMAAVAGMLPLAFALGAGSQMLQPLAIAVIGGILISMVLSLIITPAMEFYLTKETTPEQTA
jgi:multidrug efflux pump subunit AcrB